MERMVLVSGSSARVAEVGDALEKPGVAVIRAVDREVLNGGCASLPPRSLACYVQLPQETEVSEASASEPPLLDRVHRFLTGGLVARFEAALAVAPLLRPDACVVLVAGEVPRDAIPDDPHARHDLLWVMARAISGGSVGGEVKAVVVGSDLSAEEIAHVALRRGEDRTWLQSQVATVSPELSYADWKREVLSMALSDG